MADMRVAITGASGFLGGHILAAIRSAGYTPVAIVRSASAASGYLPGNIEVREADITDAPALIRALKGVPAAIHVAGMVSTNKCDVEALWWTNVTGAQNFLSAAQTASIKRAIFTSTTSAVGALTVNEPDAAMDEQAIFNLTNTPVAYVQAKRAAHEMALAAQADGLSLVIMSPSFVLGPSDRNYNTSALLDAVRKKRLPVCPHGGINPVDVRDVAKAYVAALEHPDPAPHYVLASQENLTLKHLIVRMAGVAGVRPPRVSLPNALVIAAASIAEAFLPRGDMTAAGARLGSYYWYFNAALARRDLALDCRPLTSTLKATLQWLDTHTKTAPQRPGLEQL